jgi:hypothetical protein
MTRIVTTHYRYKRPPRRRKAVALEAPVIVTTKKQPPPIWGETAAEVLHTPRFREEGEAVQPSTPREATRVISPPNHSALPANDDRKPTTTTKPAIVTASRKRRIGDDPHLPMELPLSRKPVERDGDDYKRLKAAMARRLRGE